jgi:hypothetical protein
MISPSDDDYKFLYDYIEKNNVYKYLCDSIYFDEQDKEGFINFFTNNELEDNHLWLIKRKYYLQLMGTFFCYNINKDFNYAYIYCDLFNKENMNFINNKELIDYMYEIFKKAIQLFINEMKVEKLFLPLYKENIAEIYCIEQLGFRKCVDRNIYMQKYPHDIFMFSSNS